MGYTKNKIMSLSYTLTFTNKTNPIPDYAPNPDHTSNADHTPNPAACVQAQSACGSSLVFRFWYSFSFIWACKGDFEMLSARAPAWVLLNQYSPVLRAHSLTAEKDAPTLRAARAQIYAGLGSVGGA